MNLILLFPGDFVTADVVRLSGRRLAHVSEVHRAKAGDSLVVGIAGGGIGRGVITRLDDEALEMTVSFDEQPPPPLPLKLIVAMPRPKVFNRLLVAASSLGIKEIHLLNAWRVEKSFWDTPRLSEENIANQLVLGLEQSRDTVMPRIRVHRFFRAFAEESLEIIAEGTTRLLAHPRGDAALPSATEENLTLAVGPEGGWIERELESFERAGFRSVSFGPRILRVETVVPFLVGRLMR